MLDPQVQLRLIDSASKLADKLINPMVPKETQLKEWIDNFKRVYEELLTIVNPRS